MKKTYMISTLAQVGIALLVTAALAAMVWMIMDLNVMPIVIIVIGIGSVFWVCLIAIQEVTEIKPGEGNDDTKTH